MTLRLRALVLAAGRGERLRPLTESIPKPLLPVAGRSIAARTLDALAAAGCEAAALNLFHLGGEIPAALGERHGRMPLVYSREPVLLGTLGALGPLREFLGAADLVLLVNGDSLCDWPWRQMIARHRRTGAAATLLLTSRAKLGEFGGGVGVDAGGRVVALRGERFAPARRVAAERVFAGAHVLDPQLLARVPDGPGDILDGLYLPLLREGRKLQTLTTRRRWHDLGTPRRYLEAALDLALGARNGSWLGAAARIAPGARVRRAVLEGDARIAPGADVEDALLLPAATIGTGARVARAVIGPDTEVPAGATIVGQLVVHAGRGGLARAPLDPPARR